MGKFKINIPKETNEELAAVEGEGTDQEREGAGRRVEPLAGGDGGRVGEEGSGATGGLDSSIAGGATTGGLRGRFKLPGGGSGSSVGGASAGVAGGGSGAGESSSSSPVSSGEPAAVGGGGSDAAAAGGVDSYAGKRVSSGGSAVAGGVGVGVSVGPGGEDSSSSAVLGGGESAGVGAPLLRMDRLSRAGKESSAGSSGESSGGFVPASSAGGGRRASVRAEDFVDVDEVEDDFSEVEEDFFNPLLDGDDEEELVEVAPARGAGGAVGSVGETAVVVPDMPDAPRAVRENVARREARRPRRVVDPAGEGDRKPLEKVVAVEVEVDAGGRSLRGGSSSSKTGLREARKLVAGAVEEGEAVSESVAVSTPTGREKWAVRGEAGRLRGQELELFTNLSRGKSSREDREELREVFARIDERDQFSPEEKARRKTMINRAVFGDEALRAGNRRRFTEKDRETLMFLGMFKYANARHVARVFQVEEKSMLKRLRALEKRGFVVKKDIFGAKPLWYLTENGLIVSGLDLPRVKESGITYSMLPHQFVVNHTAGNLWGGGVNVLNLEDFPVKNRVNEKGLPVFGEQVVSEFEIQSAFAKIKMTHKADTYRPIITGEREAQFARWERAGGVEFGPSPEMEEGNEYMWTLIPPAALRLAYHVPDLVVKRPRSGGGAPESIAVEVELANKPYASYERTLQAYKYDSLLYKKVIWVVKSRGAARKIEEAAVKLAMWDDERVDVTPIFTEDGIFKGKAEWTI